MEVKWAEGQVWIQTDFYEGPHDILLAFAQRAQIKWEDLSLEELFSAMVSILPSIPLEERVELILFLSHLLRLKALSLLPLAPSAEESGEESHSQGQAAGSTGPFKWELLEAIWNAKLRENQYRLSRPPSSEGIEAIPMISGLTQMRLFRAYEEVVRRYHRRHAVHRPLPLPFTPEEVEAQLLRVFEEKPQLSLSQLWAQLLPHPLYKAMAFLLILLWIQEGHLSLEWHSPWDVQLSWRS
ncbi:MAG: hypothetical protein NZ989_03375 [Bacteroidia bacterium]|nr:hypothetical protein [Bacteroidia bacterium]MDW8057293.1 hypothetical protein [Bacteroidia bacterium]